MMACSTCINVGTIVGEFYRISNLSLSLSLQNPSQVGVALQVFHNLTQLPSSLLTILTAYKEAIQHDIQNSLDPSTLVTPGNGGWSYMSAHLSLTFDFCWQYCAILYLLH